MEYWVVWFDTGGGKHMVSNAESKCFAVFDPMLWVIHTFLCLLNSSFSHSYSFNPYYVQGVG